MTLKITPGTKDAEHAKRLTRGRIEVKNDGTVKFVDGVSSKSQTQIKKLLEERTNISGK